MAALLSVSDSQPRPAVIFDEDGSVVLLTSGEDAGVIKLDAATVAALAAQAAEHPAHSSLQLFQPPF